MSRLTLIITWALLIATILVLCDADDKHWPDFSCHPVHNSSLQRNKFYSNRMGWVDCKEPYKKWKGKCPKICIMMDDQILYREKDGPRTVVFNTSKFINYFAREQGYKVDGTGGAEQDLMKKIRTGLDRCKAKYPEHERWEIIKSAPCEPGLNFFHCIDQVVGCSEVNMS